MNRNSIYYFLSILTIIIFTACTPAQKPLNQIELGDNNYTNDDNEFIERNYDNNRDNDYGYIGNRYGGYGGAINDLEQYVDLYDKTDIENSLKQINGIDDAVVVIDGNTAYCGINITQNKTNIDNLKQQVSNQIKAVYPFITKVYVTTDKASAENMRNRTNTTDIMDGDEGYLFR